MAFVLPVLSILGTIAAWRCSSPSDTKRGDHGSSSHSVRRAGFDVGHTAGGEEEAAYDLGEASVPLTDLPTPEEGSPLRRAEEDKLCPETAEPAAMAEHVSSLHALLVEQLRAACDPETALHPLSEDQPVSTSKALRSSAKPARDAPPRQDRDQPQLVVAPVQPMAVVAPAQPLTAPQPIAAVATPIAPIAAPIAPIAATIAPLGHKGPLPARAAPLISPPRSMGHAPSRAPQHQQLTAAADRQIDEMLKSKSDRLLERLHLKLGLGDPRDYSALERDYGALDRVAGPNDEDDQGMLAFDDEVEDQEDDASLYHKLAPPATTLLVD